MNAFTSLPMLLTQNPSIGQPASQVISQLRELDFVVNPLVAGALSAVLALTYRYTHKGLSYSQSFTQTIILVSVIVATVMMAIGSSLSNAFALVGLATTGAATSLGQGCTLWLATPVFAVAAAANAAGFASVRMPIPASSAFFGFDLFAQGGTVDPTAPLGIALTPALHVHIGR